MEQHKVLLIIVAVTVVLAAVIGVGIWLFYPKGDEAAESLARGPRESTGFEWEPLDYLNGDTEIPGLAMSEDEPDEFEVTYGVADDSGAAAESSAGLAPSDATSPEDSAVPHSTDRQPGIVVENQGQTQPESAAVASAASQREAPKESGVPDSRGTASAGASTSAGTPTTTRPSITTEDSDDEVISRSYWVQVISSPNRDTVEQAQKTLDDHQLGTRILTKQIDETTYYRLRLGPFAVRAEAEKFLAWVQDIDGFSGSMIFVDYSAPTIAAVAR